MKLFFAKKLLQPALAIALVGAALLTGCDKESPPPVPPPDGKLSTLGVPKESVGVIHFNLKEAQDSKVVQTFFAKIKEKAFKQEKDAEKKYTEFKTETGFDPEKDIASATLGLWFDGSKPNETDPEGFVIILRGKGSPDKINAYLGKINKNFKPLKIGEHSFLEDHGVFGFIDNQTAIIVVGENGKKSAAAAEKVLAAFSKDKAYTAPQSLYDLEKSVKKPLWLVQVEVESTKLKSIFAKSDEQVKFFQPINAQILAGDDGDKSKFRAVVQYEKPEKATAVSGIATMSFTAAKMELSKKNPELSKSLDSIKLRSEEANFIVESEQSNDEILKSLDKVLDNPLFNLLF
jgi:hypothetical protein